MDTGNPILPPPSMGGPQKVGGYRGRGGFDRGSMRGGFDRGRGRGGRGGMFPGSMNRMGGPPPPHGMMSGGPRGMRPRGLGGFPPRGGYHSRGAHMGMRGGRPMMYQPGPKQHTGADNNKTVSPVPETGAAEPPPESTSEDIPASTDPASASDTQGDGTAVESATAVQPATNGSSGGYSSYGRPPRGRGAPYMRGGLRGGYNQHINGGGGSYGNSHYGGSGGDHPGMMRRGGFRGRGSYGQGMPRTPMHSQHNSGSQMPPPHAMKRGAGGMMGPRRGRYDSAPYPQRPMIPKYHTPTQHMGSIPHQSSYAPAQHHASAQSYNYVTHDTSQTDAYAQGTYNTAPAAAAPSAYNGYTQPGTYNTHTAPPPAPTAATAYTAAQGTEYDQSQYQYSSAAYATTTDTRYPTYGQDYTQQYGAPAVDYSTAAQTDYSQQSATYDERSYAGYDTQSYQQTYAGATNYY